ncbi:uncharacterized protein LOC126907429 [Daktulosphaira vitifoliae]|uniref:uncharacterized protein LOC126907429 n=1 Tax=Daktulosphaira vitifoliae TaxID=58002 RepID=UPI0021AAC912|nr:uncharacterized protein LOC126907429 [Daktulosphaira vitifoliae]XP_050544667.1 uncharacterized protein LOC126907429 [Daktulosphaira vitifoliae]
MDLKMTTTIFFLKIVIMVFQLVTGNNNLELVKLDNNKLELNKLKNSPPWQYLKDTTVYLPTCKSITINELFDKAYNANTSKKNIEFDNAIKAFHWSLKRRTYTYIFFLVKYGYEAIKHGETLEIVKVIILNALNVIINCLKKVNNLHQVALKEYISELENCSNTKGIQEKLGEMTNIYLNVLHLIQLPKPDLFKDFFSIFTNKKKIYFPLNIEKKNIDEKLLIIYLNTFLKTITTDIDLKYIFSEYLFKRRLVDHLVEISILVDTEYKFVE